MNAKLLRILPVLLPVALLAAAPAEDHGCACGDESAGAHDKPAGHPLTGTVVDLYPDRGSALVKHDKIPGVMPAMTMLFRVDASTLATLAKGRRITATFVKRNGENWLEDVKPAVE